MRLVVAIRGVVVAVAVAAWIGCGGAPAPARTSGAAHTDAGDARGARVTERIAVPAHTAAPADAASPTAGADRAGAATHAARPAGGHGAHEYSAQAGQRSGALHHRFDDVARWSKVFDDPARDAWQQPERVLSVLELRPTMVVADIGAGTGYFAVRLARAVPRGQVIATDVEPAMVQYLTDRATREALPNVRAIATSPDDPGLSPASVDRILIVDVWHHLADRPRYARKLAAALRPGGTLAVVDFRLDARHGPPPQHRLAPGTIIAELRAAGLRASESAVVLPEQYIVIARR